MSLYMEQYLDNLQLLPADLQRKLRLLRDLDQKAQKHLDNGDKLTKNFVERLQDIERNERRKIYDEIRSNYSKAKDLGDEKVQLAMQTYEMVDKHIRRLDAELAKFEAELKRSLTKQKTDRSDQAKELLGDHKKSRKSGQNHTEMANSNKKKKTALDGGEKGRRRRRTGEGSESSSTLTGTQHNESDSSRLESSQNFMQQLASLGADVMDMPIDPNEPVYCVCRQVSYGQMIGCDNPDCPIEWFHFNCVGLATKPKGKWFCQRCNEEKKRQKT